MTILAILQRALAELERLHPPEICVHPETCETAKVIKGLRDALHMPPAPETSLTTTPEHDKLP